MKVLNHIFNTTDQPSIEVISLLINHLRVAVTKTSVKEKLQTHPAYPSLLSLSDTLDIWKIPNAALKLQSEQLKELETPFIAHLYSNDGEFVFVTSLTKDHVSFINGNRKQSKVTYNDFYHLWSGIVLIAEAAEQSGEKDYLHKYKQEQITLLRTPTIILLFSSIAFMGILQKEFTDWREYVSILTKLVGLIISIFLLVVQFGLGNTYINHFCQIGKTSNCKNVLQSSASKLFGWLSWSEIGLLYFSGSFLALLMLPVNHWLLLKILNTLALPYTVWSVYYQARVAKSWCILCLMVQGLLWIEFIIDYPISFNEVLGSNEIIVTIQAFSTPIAIWLFIKPLIIRAKKLDKTQQELQRFKNNPSVFQALLGNQKEVNAPSMSGIQTIHLGNPVANNTILMVSNPFCKPCAKAHNDLEEILRDNSHLKAEIIFLTCGDTEGKRLDIAKHLLALQASSNEIDSALTDWYNEGINNIEVWKKKYPIAEVEQQYFIEMAKAHCDWCSFVNISATPTFFINGFEKPSIYELSDLVQLFSSVPESITPQL